MNNFKKFTTDLATVESYEEGIERIINDNPGIIYDSERDEFVLKKDNTVFTYPAKSLYENDFFTGGIFEEEPDTGKLTCAIDKMEMNTDDDIIASCENGYSIFEFHKRGVPGYKLWDEEKIYPVLKLLSRTGDFIMFTLQNHIIFILLDVGYEETIRQDLMDFKLDYASYVLNIDVKKIMFDNIKLQGVILRYGIIDEIVRYFRSIYSR